MLDIKTLRQNPDSVIQALEKRGVEFDLPAFSALDARRKEADVRSQGLLAERKADSLVCACDMQLICPKFVAVVCVSCQVALL